MKNYSKNILPFLHQFRNNFSVGGIDVVVYPEDGLSGAIVFTEESGLHPTVKDWEKY